MILFVASICIIAALCLFKGETQQKIAIGRAESRKATWDRGSSQKQKLDIKSLIFRAYNSPIAIYGQVIDQYGVVVPGANVELLPHDTPGESSGFKVNLITDENGKFSASGLKGAAMGVSATKKGYLFYPPLGRITSYVQLGYSDGVLDNGHPHTNPENPLILYLHKLKVSEPMAYVAKRRWSLPLDGSPRLISIDSENGKGPHQIEVRLWSDTNIRELPGNNAYTAFDWSFEIQIRDGGLVWDQSDTEFEAPESGYRESIRYTYTADMPRENWKRFRDGRYFVKFSDGSYGRIQFSVDGGSDDMPFHMESWLNLTPGSRNLATENMTIKVMKADEPEE